MRTKEVIAIGVAAMFAGVAQAQFGFDNTPGVGAPPSIDEYMLDDGTGESNLGWSAELGGDLFGLNQFNVVAGQTLLTGVSIAWGTGVGGGAAQILVFDDPNNDGDATDITAADLLTSLAIVTGVGPTDMFIKYDIADTLVGAVGDSFFIGFWASTPAGDFPLRLDTTLDQQRSWVAGGPLGTTVFNDPNGAQLALALTANVGFSSNFMIRGNAIPAPGALALMGLAGLVGVRRRRR